MRKLKNNTVKNKVCSVVLMWVGYLSIFIDGDMTGLVVALMIGLPLFFARENVIL